MRIRYGFTIPYLLLGLAAVAVIATGIVYTADRLGTKNTNPNTNSTVACTQEAKLCPDGSYVSRQGPNCEFAACPSTNTNTAANVNAVTNANTNTNVISGNIKAVSDMRTLTMTVRESSDGVIASEISIDRGDVIDVPAGTAIYLQVFNSQGTMVSENFIDDPQESSGGIGIGRYVIRHVDLGERWRLVDRNDAVLTQGSLGKAFLDYCRGINFTDRECLLPDADGDQIPDVYDNCPNKSNPDQSEERGQIVGQACANS